MATTPAATSFVLPALYSFPPFFTLQPVDETRNKQLEEWRHVIVAWHAHMNRADMRVMEWPLWENTVISRRLSNDGIAAVMAHVIKTVCKIFARSPADWANDIHTWVVARGMGVSGSVYTVYEMHSGDAFFDAPCHGMDAFILMKALEVLERNDLCTIRRRDAVDECGVKFKER